MLSGELHPHTPSLRWKKVLGHEGISGASSHPPSCGDLLPNHLLSSLRCCWDHRQVKAGQRSQALSHSPQSHNQVRSEPRALALLCPASLPLPVSPSLLQRPARPQALSKPLPNTHRQRRLRADPGVRLRFTVTCRSAGPQGSHSPPSAGLLLWT